MRAPTRPNQLASFALRRFFRFPILKSSIRGRPATGKPVQKLRSSAGAEASFRPSSGMVLIAFLRRSRLMRLNKGIGYLPRGYNAGGSRTRRLLVGFAKRAVGAVNRTNRCRAEEGTLFDNPYPRQSVTPTPGVARSPSQSLLSGCQSRTSFAEVSIPVDACPIAKLPDTEQFWRCDGFRLAQPMQRALAPGLAGHPVVRLKHWSAWKLRPTHVRKQAEAPKTAWSCTPETTSKAP